MSFSLPPKVVDCLKSNPGKKFTTWEIAKWILKHYEDDCRAKQQKSKATAYPIDNDTEFCTQISSSISTQRQSLEKNHKIKITEGSPRKYYHTESTDVEEVNQAENTSTTTVAASGNPHVTEHDLYPMLAEFLWSEYQIYSKRIDEKRSSNPHGPKGNKWLYPDLVGMEDLSQ
ncbi:MAG: HrgA protein, partial [Candidatus Oxydemutatoraceae bacterium WSBS_2016_MAG_OTU14]